MQRRLTDLPTESVSVVPVSYRFTAKSLDDVYGSLPAGEEEADRHSHLPGENRLSGLLAVEAARRIIKQCNVCDFVISVHCFCLVKVFKIFFTSSLIFAL